MASCRAPAGRTAGVRQRAETSRTWRSRRRYAAADVCRAEARALHQRIASAPGGAEEEINDEECRADEEAAEQAEGEGSARHAREQAGPAGAGGAAAARGTGAP